MVGAACAFFWGTRLSSDGSDDRLVFHRATHAQSTRRSWSAVDLALVVTSRNNEVFATVAATETHEYYSWHSRTIAHTSRKASSIEEAESYLADCLENPQGYLGHFDKNSENLQHFAEQLSSMKVASKISGFNKTLSNTKNSAELAKSGKLVISLALGQFLVREISKTERLSKDIENILEYYLMNVPLKVGHWGPFKALFKSLENRSGAESLYSLAVARIDGFVIVPEEPSIEVEELEFLRPLFDVPIAGRDTFSYLARRGRRIFRRINKTDSEKYVNCANSFLRAADSLGGDLEVNSRRTLAEIVYGRGASDFTHGRGPLDLPPSPQRYNRRWDRSPKLWNKHAKKVSQIWSKTSNIADIQIWAFNVLKSQKISMPELKYSALSLALISPSTAVRKEACSQIADQPQKFFRLDFSSAVAFLNFGSEKQFNAVLLVLELNKPNKVILEAIASYLNGHGLAAILRGASHSELSRKAQKLLAFYFRVHLGSLSEVGALNLALHIGRTNGFRPPELWRESLTALPIKTLVELRLKLANISSSSKKIIDDACLVAIRSAPDEKLAMALVHSPTAALRKLAWAMLSSDQAAPDAQIATWRSLVEFSEANDGLKRLKQCVLSKDRFNTLLSHPDSVPVLSQIAIKFAPTDRRTAKHVLYLLSDTDERSVILDTLDTIATTCQSWPWGNDVPLLMALIVNAENTPSILWNGLTEGLYEHIAQKLMSIPPVLKTILDVIRPDEIVSIVPLQADILASILTMAPSRLAQSQDLSIAVATCPASNLAATAISILEARGKIRSIYLPLLESRLPIAMSAAQRYLETITGKKTLTTAIISVCDSGIREAREFGLTMLRERLGDYDITEVYSALAEHKSTEVTAEVARHMLLNGQVRATAANIFDHRILRTRRQGRKAKELVKRRLGGVSGPNVIPIGINSDGTFERINSLLALARGRSQRDREWALRELVRLSESGTEIPGFQVTQTTG
jgi:hypothetical protein